MRDLTIPFHGEFLFHNVGSIFFINSWRGLSVGHSVAAYLILESSSYEFRTFSMVCLVFPLLHVVFIWFEHSLFQNHACFST